jgi:hypothetical protein
VLLGVPVAADLQHGGGYHRHEHLFLFLLHFQGHIRIYRAIGGYVSCGHKRKAYE